MSIIHTLSARLQLVAARRLDAVAPTRRAR